MAGPDEPIAAVRVPAESLPAGPEPAAAPELAIASAGAAAAPVEAPAAAAAPAPDAVALVAERPSLLETASKDKPADIAVDKPAEVAAKPADQPAEKPTPEPDKPVDKPADAKPAEVAKPAEEKPAEAKPEALAPVEYKYELPPTLKVDDALRTEMHAAFDAFRADPAQGVQGLIDLHNKVVTDLQAQHADATLRNQHTSFNDTRTQWNKGWAADEQIGGAGYQTALRAVARMRDQFVSAEAPGTDKYQADRKSFEEFLRVTGAGDHPAFGRFLHNVARAFDEPPLPPTNPKPAPNNGARPGSKRERMYDHPSSSKSP